MTTSNNSSELREIINDRIKTVLSENLNLFESDKSGDSYIAFSTDLIRNAVLQLFQAERESIERETRLDERTKAVESIETESEHVKLGGDFTKDFCEGYASAVRDAALDLKDRVIELTNNNLNEKGIGR